MVLEENERAKVKHIGKVETTIDVLEEWMTTSEADFNIMDPLKERIKVESSNRNDDSILETLNLERTTEDKRMVLKENGAAKVRRIVEQYRKIVNQIEGFKPSEKNALENLGRTIEDNGKDDDILDVRKIVEQYRKIVNQIEGFKLIGILEVRKIIERYRKIVNQIEGFKHSEENALENLERTIEDNRKDDDILDVRKIVEQYRKIVNKIEGFKLSEENALENLERITEDKRRVIQENETTEVKHIGKVETTIDVLEERMTTSEAE
ncbi:hypothetical protein WN944_013436 [Citrus x changshan-huyou]|uniref:Uncharacterized protein n=1 Tax=Citrus x changshan-huyou TaxID=2935761 RepID=A0AAP0M5Z2_9ROSI